MALGTVRLLGVPTDDKGLQVIACPGPPLPAVGPKWQWWRQGAPWVIGPLVVVILIVYGMVPTSQPAHFGLVDAAYGGILIILSRLWGWGAGCIVPDRCDVVAGSSAELERPS
jgi:hypothetical protein